MRTLDYSFSQLVWDSEWNLYTKPLTVGVWDSREPQQKYEFDVTGEFYSRLADMFCSYAQKLERGEIEWERRIGFNPGPCTYCPYEPTTEDLKQAKALKAHARRYYAISRKHRKQVR